MTIEYKQPITLVILNQVLEWCYTDILDFSSLEMYPLLELLKISKLLDVDRLCYLCEKEIRQRLSVDSVFIILKNSKELDMKEILELATSFAHQHWPQVCGHKQGMEIIGIELFQELTIGMQHYKPETKKYCSPEALPTVKSTIINDYKEILTECRFSDAELLFPASGETVKFHRAIVAAHSKPLFQLISQNNKSKQYVIEGLDSVAGTDLLQYIYYGDTTIDPIGACRLIECAIMQYALQHMLDDCTRAVSEGITDKSSIDILRITYLPDFQTDTMKDLRKKVLSHICKNFKEIPIPTVRDTKPANIAYQMTADILDTIYKDYSPSSQVNSSIQRTTSGDEKRRDKGRERKKKTKTPRGTSSDKKSTKGK